MTVKELIEVLSKQPQNAIVEVGDGYGDWSKQVSVYTDTFEVDDEESNQETETICFIDGICET